MEKTNKEKNRLLKGFIREKYTNSISVYCPDCKTWHQHGECEGSRSPHCTKRLINNYSGKPINNPNYNPENYDIAVFTKTELKPFKTHILELVLTDREKKIIKLMQRVY